MQKIDWAKVQRFLVLGYLICVSVVAVLGYLIAPDNTQDANRAIPEYSFLPPMRIVHYLALENSVEKKESNFILHYLFGNNKPHKYIPLADDYQLVRSLTNSEYCVTALNQQRICYPQTQGKIVRFCYVLGSDLMGRDVLSRLLIGTRVTIGVGLLATLLAFVIGAGIGLVAGWYGRWIDTIAQWLITVIWSIPSVLLAIVISFAIGKGFTALCVAIGLTIWVEPARQTRALTYQLKTSGFVEANRALGLPSFRILVYHILPNLLPPLVVVSCAAFTTAILLEAGLSFLGLGLMPPTPSWGTLMYEGYAYIMFENGRWLAIFPGILIILLIICVNLASLNLSRKKSI